jgi:hypothetical protein
VYSEPAPSSSDIIITFVQFLLVKIKTVQQAPAKFQSMKFVKVQSEVPKLSWKKRDQAISANAPQRSSNFNMCSTEIKQFQQVLHRDQAISTGAPQRSSNFNR